MKEVALKSGGKVIVPDDATPEELAWVEANRVPSTSADVGKSALSGLMEGASRAPYFGGDLAALTMRGVNAVRPDTIPKEYETLLSDRVMGKLKEEGGIYSHTPQTTAGRYTNAATNALGGAAVLGGPSLIAPKTAALPGTISAIKAALSRLLRSGAAQAPAIGIGAEFGGDLGRGFDETQPKSGPGALAGGLVTALALALGSKAATPNHPRVLRESTDAMTPEDWTESFAQRARLEKAGAKTATLADAVPQNSQLRGLARDMSNSTGGEALTRKLAGRSDAVTGEIPRMMDDAVTALNPNPVSVSGVGSQMADRAGNAVGKAVNTRTDAYLPILQKAPPVAQEDITRILKTLEAQMREPGKSAVEIQALKTAAETIRQTPLRELPRNPGGQMVVAGAPDAVPPQMGVNLEALSKNLKELKKGIVSGPGGNLDVKAGRDAYNVVDGLLKETSPAYKQAMQLYDDVTKSTVDPISRGLVGQIADLRGRSLGETSLPGVVRRSSLEEGKAVLPGLADSPQLKSELARTLMERNRQPVTTASAGSQDALKLRQLAEVLADPKAKETFKLKTNAADTLAKLTSEAGMDSTTKQLLGQSWLSTLLQPFNELARRSRLRLTGQETKVLSELIANPTENNLRILQEIATQETKGRALLGTLAKTGAIQGGTLANQ